MGNKTSNLADDNFISAKHATEYFLPSADSDYPEFLKDIMGVDNGYAEVLDFSEGPVQDEGPYLVTNLLFDQPPPVSHTCLRGIQFFFFVTKIAFREFFAHLIYGFQMWLQICKVVKLYSTAV